MANYWISIGASLTLGLGLLVVMVSAWLPKRELILDWLMPGGASLALVCFVSRSMILFTGSAFESFDSLMFSNLGMATGVLLYALGFLMDRLARRRQNALSQQLPGSF
jgi:hypothetical protein